MKVGSYKRLCATNETVRWFYGPWFKMPSGIKHKIQRMTRAEIIATATAKKLSGDFPDRDWSFSRLGRFSTYGPVKS